MPFEVTLPEPINIHVRPVKNLAGPPGLTEQGQQHLVTLEQKLQMVRDRTAGVFGRQRDRRAFLAL